MLRYFPIVLKNSLRNRRRSLLTISSLALSLCLLGIMAAMYFVVYLGEAPPAQALRLIARNRVSLGMPMPAYYIDRIRPIPGVKEAMEWQWFGGVYKDARDPQNFFARFGIDPKKVFTIFSEFEVPDDQKKAFMADRNAAMVGRVLAERLGFKLGDRITIKGDIYPTDLDLTVKAIYDDPESAEVFFFHWAYVREGLPAARKDMVGTVSILADSPEAVPRIAQAIDEMFRNSPQQTRTESERAFGLGFLKSLGNIKLFLMAVCGAVTFTILLVTANTMAMSVRERVKEVGIMKTLGFRNGTILGLVVGEAVLISLVGGLVGYLLSSMACAAMRQSPFMFGAMRNLAVTPTIGGLLLSASVVIALVSSFIPAWNASRTTILDAMRYTG
jgi:putative ABC transport system permease protein